MRHNLTAVGAAFLLMSVAAGLTDVAPAAYGQTATPTGNILVRSAFEHPNADPPTGSTIFHPATAENLFTAQMIATLSQDQQKQAMQVYAGRIQQLVEKTYQDYGYEKNDLGVALGACLETTWEISNGSFKTGTASAQDKEKTKATIRQMQNALLASPAYKTLSDKNKQLLYEACSFLCGHLATQWIQAGSVPTRKTLVQDTARKQMQTIFGAAPDTLTRRPDGAFVSNLSTNKEKKGQDSPVPTLGKAAGNQGGKPGTSDAQPIAAVKGPLPAASLHGARLFIRYTFLGTTTHFDHLILFPDGAAFTDLPSKPIAQFDEATLRAGLKPFDVGTWKASGDSLILTFPNKRRDQITTLRRTPRGWYDGAGAIDSSSPYNTYFPVIPVTPQQIQGAWHSKSLTTVGFAGGAAPMVAAGSTSDRVFNPDGTFSGGKNSFASATTANVGDGFKTGGDVGVYNTNNKKQAGRWRLDGPLLTMEMNGQRMVTPAFILPHWNKTGTPELLINGDWWQRPEKGR